jgi:hypothetical protein
MKSNLVKVLVAMFFFIIPSLACAYTYTIYDNDSSAYWGGTVVNAEPTKYGDVIGSPYFNVDQMVVTRNGADWTVTLSGPYFDYRKTDIDEGLPKAYTPGDLYINSTGWITQDVSNNYSNDFFSPAEKWDYVVTKSPTGADVWGLYTLDYNKITWTTAPNNYVYRSTQAWTGGAGTLITQATYTETNTADGHNNTITFSFNTGNVTWTGPVGFHWDMKCGNDVVEGMVPAVPEPTTMLLLGFGLIGLAGVRRKFNT